jgi:hypothetical protein
MKSVHNAGREAEIDRLLGDKLLFDMTAPQAFGGPSPATLYRAVRAKIFPVVRNGGRTQITRETMKKILLEGVGYIPWRPDGSDRNGLANVDA